MGTHKDRHIEPMRYINYWTIPIYTHISNQVRSHLQSSSADDVSID